MKQNQDASGPPAPPSAARSADMSHTLMPPARGVWTPAGLQAPPSHTPAPTDAGPGAAAPPLGGGGLRWLAVGSCCLLIAFQAVSLLQPPAPQDLRVALAPAQLRGRAFAASPSPAVLPRVRPGPAGPGGWSVTDGGWSVTDGAPVRPPHRGPGGVDDGPGPARRPRAAPAPAWPAGLGAVLGVGLVLGLLARRARAPGRAAAAWAPLTEVCGAGPVAMLAATGRRRPRRRRPSGGPDRDAGPGDGGGAPKQAGRPKAAAAKGTPDSTGPWLCGCGRCAAVQRMTGAEGAPGGYPHPPPPCVFPRRAWAGMHQKGRDLGGGPRSGYTGGWRRLPKRLGAVTVGYKCH